MREKLIALLNLAPTDYAGNSNPIRTADYLIANGVTVRERGEWEWKLFPKADGTVERKAVCNRCGLPNKQYTPPYCPHCGADMTKGGADV